MPVNATVLNDAIYLLQEQNDFNKYENRMSEYAAYDAHKKYANELLTKDAIESIKVSARQPVNIPVLNKNAGSVIDVRSCTIPDPTKDSEFVTLVWATLGFNIGITPAVLVDNYITAEAYLADQIKDGIKAVCEDLDALAVANLEAGKTGVFPYTVWANDGTEYQPTQAQKDDFYKSVPAAMKRHDLSFLPYIDIANTEAITLEMFQQSQGAANSVNEAYAFSNEMARFDFFRTNSITPAVGEDEIHYLAAPGSIGVYEWIDIDARLGHRINDGNYWTTMVDPIKGEQWGVRYFADCSNESAQLAGLQATMKEGWQWTKDYCFLTAHHSDTDTSILKAVIQS